MSSTAQSSLTGQYGENAMKSGPQAQPDGDLDEVNQTTERSSSRQQSISTEDRQQQQQQRLLIDNSHRYLALEHELSIKKTGRGVMRASSTKMKSASSKRSHQETKQEQQHLSRRHSSAAIVPLSLTSSELCDPAAITVPNSSGGGGDRAYGLARARSSSSRASAGGSRRHPSGSVDEAQHPSNNNNNVHRLNVPSSGGQWPSRSAEQLERIQLLLLTPSWTSTTSYHSSVSPASAGGDDLSDDGHGRQHRKSIHGGATSPRSPQHQLTSWRQQQQQPQKHTRSQSVRATSAKVVVSVADAGKSYGGHSGGGGGGGRDVTTASRTNSLSVQQRAPRPRGSSLPSNRVHSAAAAAAAAGCCDGGLDQQQPNSSLAGTANYFYCGGEEEEADYYLLRHFIVHGKNNKVVNRGDSFRRLRHQQQQQAQQQAQQLAQQQAQQRSQVSIGQQSQHSSTSSISTDNVAGSPPLAAQQQPSSSQQQQQGQYYSHSDYQSSSSSRRASLYGNLTTTQASTGGQCCAPTPDPFRVLMLGSPGVGKTALTAQFMTSEYLNTYEASLDEDSCDRCVSVLLDGEESQLIFIDHPHGEISVENCLSTYNPHAYVIVYSVVDAESLREAEEILHFLWRHSLTSTFNTPAGQSAGTSGRCEAAANNGDPSSTNQPTTTKPVAPYIQLPPPPPVVILVANKIDLVRSRIISPQAGKSLATSFDCKYIETSSGMQHNVDELLVGILKQIRLRIQMAEQLLSRSSAAPGGSSAPSSPSSRSFFRRRSGRRRQNQQQQRVNYNKGASKEGEEGACWDADDAASAIEGSCCITSAAVGITIGASSVCQRISPSSLLFSSSITPPSPSVTGPTSKRRSASFRVRRMLGKAVWTCADYYHRNKSRSCEDLFIL